MNMCLNLASLQIRNQQTQKSPEYRVPQKNVTFAFKFNLF